MKIIPQINSPQKFVELVYPINNLNDQNDQIIRTQRVKGAMVSHAEMPSPRVQQQFRTRER